MNKGIGNYFRELAAKASKTTNSIEAQEIKKKLIKIGFILIIIGGIGLFTCFVGFAALGFYSTSHFGKLRGLILIPFCLFIPFGLVLHLGILALTLGLGIVVAKATVNFVDPNRYCSKCGDKIDSDEKFCSKCGSPLLTEKICSECGTTNDVDADFCKNCGHSLN